MRSNRIPILVACVLLGSGTTAFEILDDNRDGALSLAEAKGLPALSRRFARLDLDAFRRLDRNGNRLIERGELEVPAEP
jgi:hypothetical protein